MISFSGLTVLFALINNNGDIGHACLDSDFSKALVFIAVHRSPQTGLKQHTSIISQVSMCQSRHG